MRWTRVLMLAVLALLVVACGGSGGGNGGGGDGGDGGNGSEETQAEAPQPDEGNGGGGEDAGDRPQLAGDLEPPNATETTRMSADGGFIISWRSSESVDSLESFYDDKIAELGLNVLGKQSVEGAHTWIFGDEDGSGPQGGVTVTEDGSGGSLASVTIASQ
jgi:hypothetical protein